MRTHNCGELRKKDVGKKVILCGWVRRLRDLGGLVFLDLRDIYGQTQVVFEPGTSIFDKAKKLGLQFVVKIKGMVRPRPEHMINPNLPTGEIEVVAEALEVLNTSPPTPFVIEDNIKIQEETRLRYRFLDLRRPEMQKNIVMRHRMTFKAREYLNSLGFLEIETPYLAKSTPEGARDFLVPSRMYPGKFYALPQSPQLYKQVLMSSGMDKYFQVVRCFRDEDLRADRQPEFTQIDIEMSFVEMEDIFEMTEGLMKAMLKEAGIEVTPPFDRLPYSDAIRKYGTDKPDTRYSLEIVTLTDLFKGTENRIIRESIQKGGEVVALSLETDLSRKELENIEEEAKKSGSPGIMWFKKKNGEVTGPLKKFISTTILEHLSGTTNIILVGKFPDVYKWAGSLRTKLIEDGKLKAEKEWAFLWVIDFPLFELNEEGRLEPAHHMFTMPKEEHIELLDKDPLKVIGKQYDLVLNGVEIASGSIRVHRRDLQEKIMALIGLTKEEMEKKFGFLLEALEFGAPPHGGIAVGLDRLIAMALGRKTIRDVIAFPKTTKAQALYEGSPSEVTDEQLEELHIRIIHKERG